MHSKFQVVIERPENLQALLRILLQGGSDDSIV